ncbi:hypothetical protein FRC17_008087 [Serendipita sp. 399]|nr:hypothetical protein FRC17_008087 [Serendipita sp. 399]
MSTISSTNLPVELWMAIFKLVLRNWLVPHPALDLVDSIKFLRMGCAPIWEYFRVERARTNLRLVCKRWSTILSSPTVRFAVQVDPKSSDITHYMHAVDRIHNLDPTCFCEGEVLVDGVCEARRFLGKRQRMEEENYASRNASVQVLRTRVLCTRDTSPESLAGLLECNPLLEALCTILGTFVSSEKLLSSSTLQGIIYLTLGDKLQGTKEIVQISLPNLLFLDYEPFRPLSRTESFNKPVPMETWSLLQLRTLILRKVAENGTLPPAFIRFILSHKSTLTQLVMFYPTHGSQPSIEENTLLELVVLLPNLEIFGTEAVFFLQITPSLTLSLSAERQRTLLLHHWPHRQLLGDKTGRIKENLNRLFISPKLFTDIQLYGTWEELTKEALHSRSHPLSSAEYLLTVLQCAHDLAIPIQDGERVSLSDKEWKQWKTRIGQTSRD